MVKCWASCLGNCSDKKSGEHYLSKNLWNSDKVIVKGLWSDEEKEIGINSLTANVLCTTHNSNLSWIDTGIGEVSDVIHELYRLYDVRKRIGNKNLCNFIKLKINGNILEKWCVKFLIGLFCAVGKDSYWHETNTSPLSPPEGIVKAVFSSESFKKPIGLHLNYIVGENHYHKHGNVICEFLNHPKGGTVGAKIEFNGFQFLIWLKEESFNFSIVKQSEKLLYHPQKLLFKNVKQALQFEWN